jgi:hypothetical protein
LTQERWEGLKIEANGFLLPAEVKLVANILTMNNMALVWEDDERGHFRQDMFLDIKIPTIEHIPYMDRPIPIPPGIQEEFTC